MRPKLETGTLFFTGVTGPEDAQSLVRFLQDYLLPRERFYFIDVRGDETGTTISFRRRDQP